jgi:general secretion pathway protein N
LSDNPLWDIPLAQFSDTRARPIFSPSRRPPPALAPPIEAPKRLDVAKAKEPDRPQLSLVGTITSDTERIGIFLDQTSNLALRLKLGEDFHGWKLGTVHGREATLEKGGQALTLELPQPGVEKVSSPPPPASVRIPPGRD